MVEALVLQDCLGTTESSWSSIFHSSHSAEPLHATISAPDLVRYRNIDFDLATSPSRRCTPSHTGLILITKCGASSRYDGLRYSRDQLFRRKCFLSPLIRKDNSCEYLFYQILKSALPCISLRYGSRANR